jgi:hypothetical protein
MRKQSMDLPLQTGIERKLFPMRSKSRGKIIALGVNSSLFFYIYESDLVIYFNMLLLSMVERKKKPLQPSSLIFQRKSRIDNTYALFDTFSYKTNNYVKDPFF